MLPRFILAFLIVYAGSAAALVDVGPAVDFDSRPPGEGDIVYGLSLTACFGPASICVRGAVMPTDSRESSGGPYVDEWERRYYSADVTPLVAFGAEAVAPVAGVNYRQSRFSDYDYKGGVRNETPVPFTYTDGETTSRRILAVGGVKFGDEEGLAGAAWGGVGAALHKRTGTAWIRTSPSTPIISWSLDADWKTLEFAAGAAAAYEVVKHFGITGGFEVANRIVALDDDAPSERPVGFTLFFAPVLQL
jgi:hypothetical protein